MGCRLDDFTIGTARGRYTQCGHKVEFASATTVGGAPVLDGFVYWIDGKFQGFTFSEAGVRDWAGKKIRGETP